MVNNTVLQLVKALPSLLLAKLLLQNYSAHGRAMQERGRFMQSLKMKCHGVLN